MLATKLTLSIPPKVLSRAKSYSRKTGQPLSRLVSRYFSALSGVGEGRKEITLKVRRVTGLVSSKKRDEDLLFEALASKYR